MDTVEHATLATAGMKWKTGLTQHACMKVLKGSNMIGELPISGKMEIHWPKNNREWD